MRRSLLSRVYHLEEQRPALIQKFLEGKATFLNLDPADQSAVLRALEDSTDLRLISDEELDHRIKELEQKIAEQEGRAHL